MSSVCDVKQRSSTEFPSASLVLPAARGCCTKLATPQCNVHEVVCIRAQTNDSLFFVGYLCALLSGVILHDDARPHGAASQTASRRRDGQLVVGDAYGLCLRWHNGGAQSLLAKSRGAPA